MTVTTDFNWDSKRKFLNEGVHGIVLGLKQNVAQCRFVRDCTGTQTARGSMSVCTDSYCDSNKTWPNNGFSGFELRLKQNVVQ